jgi:hypothetical protein
MSQKSAVEIILETLAAAGMNPATDEKCKRHF